MASQNTSRDALLDKIKEEQLAQGFVSQEFMTGLAEAAGVSVGEVYGVTTFYGFLSTEPQGKHVIRVCKSVPCCLKDAEKVIAWIAEELGIEPGQTTPDQRFTFELTNCIGACDAAPAMLIDDQVFGDLTREKTADVLRSYE